MTCFSVLEGDLLDVDADAIVNPANSSLLGRGGLSGQILAAGGAELIAACRELKVCPPGHAVITPGFNLRSPWVIHAVGPQWRGGNRNEADVLAQCYQSIMSLASAHNIRRLALPAISTGIFGYPLQPATVVAVATMTGYAESHGIHEVLFVAWNRETADVYQRELGLIT